MLKGQDEARVQGWIEELRGPFRTRIYRMVNSPTELPMSAEYSVMESLMAQRVEAWVRERHPNLEPVNWEEAVRLVKEFEAKPRYAQRDVLHACKPDPYGVSSTQIENAFWLAAAVLNGVPI